MTFPSVVCRIAFVSDAFAASPTWVDVSAQLRGGNTQRGRQHELDRIEAGIATIVLDNEDGRFWPNNQGSLVNLVTNPSFEVDLAGWTDVGAGAVRTAASAYIDTWSMAQDVSLVASGERTYSAWMSVTAGLGYTLSFYLNKYLAIGTGRATLRWADGAYATISDTTLDLDSGTHDWKRYSATATAPVGSVYAQVIFSTSGVTIGSTWLVFFDGIQLEQAAAATTYTDGAQDNCRWAGTAHASQSYRGGPYYGYVDVGKRLNIRATYNAVTYDLVTGFIESWQHGFAGGAGKIPVVTVTAVDLTKALALYELNNAGYAQELSDVRIGNVLDDLGWPAADCDLNTGQTTVIATGALADTNAWDHLGIVQQSELGIVFVAGDGHVQFRDRHARLKTPFLASSATFGDDAGEMGYNDLTLEHDDAHVYNDVRITRSGGTEQTASDATSQAAYGQRTLSRTGLLMTTDGEALDQAGYLLARYKSAALRVRSIVIRPMADEANLFPKILAYDISTRITVRLNDASIDAEYHIEQITHSFSPKRWETRWQLSDADSQLYWVLGTSELGTTTGLAY